MKPGILLLGVLIASGAFVVPAAAQDAIVQGEVIAAADRSARPGVTVTLRSSAGGESREATTDAAGRFVFPRIPPQQYIVRFDVANLANNIFVIARESEFPPGQYSIPRQPSMSAQLRF